LRLVQEEERQAALQAKRIAAKLQMQRQASIVLDLYKEHHHARDVAQNNQVDDRRWVGKILRSHLDSAHKCFIGAIPKGTLLPTIIDVLTNFFGVPENLAHASQALELAEEVAIANALAGGDEDEDEPVDPDGHELAAMARNR
jgi:hypothetical protein